MIFPRPRSRRVRLGLSWSVGTLFCSSPRRALPPLVVAQDGTRLHHDQEAADTLAARQARGIVVDTIGRTRRLRGERDAEAGSSVHHAPPLDGRIGQHAG